MENKRIIKENIRGILPRGAAAILCKKSGKSLGTCINVLEGKSQNKAVLDVLAEYLQELADTKSAIRVSIDALSKD